MFLSIQEVVKMDENTLKKFLEYRYSEGLYLDYKEQISGRNDKEKKREFLKDVTAFANAHGGNILIGVKEPDESLSVDDHLLGLESGDSMHSAI